jgi:hypothetical protein
MTQLFAYFIQYDLVDNLRPSLKIYSACTLLEKSGCIYVYVEYMKKYGSTDVSDLRMRFEGQVNVMEN